MPMVAADWSLDRQTGNIRYIGHDHVRFGGTTPSYATVIEFHRFWQQLAYAGEYTGDDEIDIVSTNPTSRATDNIVALQGAYNIDATAAEHLYDGTISQSGGAVRWDGIVNYGKSTATIQIHQNGAVLADDWWNLTGGGGLNADAAQGISHRFMIQIRTGGADVNGRRLLGTSRKFGNTYHEFPINGTNPGNNVLALSDASDVFNQTVEATVAGWTTITNTTQGYKLLDVNNDTTNEPYYSEWNKDTFTIAQFYERMKWLTRDGSSSTLYGLNGELFRGITHEVTLTTPRTGTFSAFEAVSWSGGTGQMFAINSTTAGTKMWIQLLTGVAPTNTQTITGGGSAATATASGTATERPVSTPFCGASTGSALLGAYGFALETADMSNADRFVALDNVTYQPPNNVTFTVGGVVSGDRVLVGPWDGTTTDADGNPEVDFNQLTHSQNITGAAVTSITVGQAIPSDTPATGWIRVEADSGLYHECAYTSWAGSTFTITSKNFSTNPSNGTVTPKNVWIGYIDKATVSTSEQFTSVFLSTRNLVVKVRDGGGTPIKEFITSAQLTATGGSVTAIRTSDT